LNGTAKIRQKSELANFSATFFNNRP